MPMRPRLYVLIVLISSITLAVGCGSSSDGTGTPGSDASSGGPNRDAGGAGDASTDDAGTGGDLTPATLLDGPEDWRDEVIYFIMTDRFADGDSGNNAAAAFFDRDNAHKYHGGDLQGIRDQADYLNALGVTAIWITPVVENVIAVGIEPDVYTGYHGYGAHDMSQIDRHLADSVADYRDFVSHMHERGIRVIQDIVVNHMGDVLKYRDDWTPSFSSAGYERIFIEDEFPVAGNPWVGEQLATRPRSAPFDQISSYHNNGSIDFANLTDEMRLLGDFNNLDDLATERSEVRDALIAVYRDWIIRAGIDGFRIDTVAHVDDAFWDHFPARIREQVNTMNPRAKFMQFGEVIDSHAALAKYTVDSGGGARIDSMLNYELYFAIKSVFAEGAATSALTDELGRRATLRDTAAGPGGSGLSAKEAPINFIDNHDKERFLDTVTRESEMTGKIAVMHSALMYLMTTQGVPCIYYNTENDTVGDPDAPADLLIPGEYGRIDMPDFRTTGKPTFDRIAELIALRNAHVALRRGDMAVLADDNSRDGFGDPVPAGTFAFSRKIAGQPAEDVFVFINTSDGEIAQDVIVGTSDTLREIYSSADPDAPEITHPPTSQRVTVTVPAYGMKVLKR